MRSRYLDSSHQQICESVLQQKNMDMMYYMVPLLKPWSTRDINQRLIAALMNPKPHIKIASKYFNIWNCHKMRENWCEKFSEDNILACLMCLPDLFHQKEKVQTSEWKPSKSMP